jgi:hypothetical protein
MNDFCSNLVMELELDKLVDLKIGALHILPITKPDMLAELGCILLRRTFKPEVLGAIEQEFANAFKEKGNDRTSLPIAMCAAVEVGADFLFAGIVVGEVMLLSADAAMFAIGYLATNPLLKKLSFRGVGSALLQEASTASAAVAHEIGRSIVYDITEAEPASLGFWKKQGFLWPEGSVYFQPPIKFNENGERLFDEVSETLLLRKYSGERNKIASKELSDTVSVLYDNWFIPSPQASCSAAAHQKIHDYVMADVFGKFAHSIAGQESIQLLSEFNDVDARHRGNRSR